ncbi:unnamed protein product [Boreogadus saida]
MMDRCNKVNKVFSGPSLWFSPCLVSLKGSLSSARSVLLTYAWIRLSSLANTLRGALGLPPEMVRRVLSSGGRHSCRDPELSTRRII